tara:strand:+ start:930 stop:1277 length:348 start_codon:yes stop_codon:yes gene_type:complete
MRPIEDTLEFIRCKAKEHAEALSQREYLKEFRKSKKCMLINEAELNGLKGAQARECYAYAHDDYVALLDGLKIAIERECELRHLIKSAELRIEVWRSQGARERAEISAYNSKVSM